MFGLKSFTVAAIFCLVLAVLTVLFRFYLEQRWSRVSQYLPLQLTPHTTTEIRKKRHEEDNIHLLYIDPAALPMKTLDEEKEAILPELEAIKKEEKARKKVRV